MKIMPSPRLEEVMHTVRVVVWIHLLEIDLFSGLYAKPEFVIVVLCFEAYYLLLIVSRQFFLYALK